MSEDQSPPAEQPPEQPDTIQVLYFDVDPSEAYPYTDDAGVKKFGDPLLLHYQISSAFRGGVAQAIEALQADTTPLAEEAAMKIRNDVCRIFELTPHDSRTNEGAKLSFCLKLLRDFLGWCVKKKTGIEVLPTPGPTSVETPSEEPSPTTSTSESPSIEVELEGEESIILSPHLKGLEDHYPDLSGPTPSPIP